MKSIPEPTVSICLPVFNGRKFLAESIESALAQDYQDFELLISDDCSNDDSLTIIEKYAKLDSRIRYWRNNTRLGLFANYNFCMKESRGQFLKLHAQDDLWRKDLVLRQVQILEQNPDVGLVSCRRLVVDEFGRTLPGEYQPVGLVDILGDSDSYSGRQVIKACIEPLMNLIGEPCAVMLRSNLQMDGFSTHFKHIGDLEYWLRILWRCDLALINEELVFFRKHKDSTTALNTKQLWSWIDFVTLSEALQPVLKQLNRSEEEFLRSNLAIVAKHLEGQLVSGEIDLHSIEETDDHSPHDVAALKKLLLLALSIANDVKQDKGPGGISFTQMKLLSNELQIKEREKILRGVLGSFSWQMTRPLRELKTLVSAADTTADNVLDLTEGSPFEQQDQYLRYLRQQQKRLFKSKSWKLTRPLRKGFRGKKPLVSKPDKPGNLDTICRPGAGQLRPEAEQLRLVTGQLTQEAGQVIAESITATHQTELKEAFSQKSTKAEKGANQSNIAKTDRTSNAYLESSFYEHDLVVGAIFRNEADYLSEWIEYHLLVGVQKLYLFDNLSTDDWLPAVEPYVKEGIVELFDWPMKFTDQAGFLEMQLGAYRRLVDICEHEAKWIAFIDVDEFLVPHKTDNLLDFLSSYDDVGGVSVNWKMFGTSSIHKVQEHQLLTETMTRCAERDDPANHYVKTISRTDRIRRCKDPHAMLYDVGFKQVDSDRRPLFASKTSNVLDDKISINHYWTRDVNHFLTEKVRSVHERKDAQAIGELNRRLIAFNLHEDSDIQRFVPQLKARLMGRFPQRFSTESSASLSNFVGTTSNLIRKSTQEYEIDLAIAAVFQNEARFLKEWIEYHRLVGVQKFLLFNNLSDDDYLSVLKKYIDEGVVDLVEWPFKSRNLFEFHPIQCCAHNYAIRYFSGRAKWLSLHDTDEFMLPLEGESALAIIDDYAEFGGIAMPYRVFGTSSVKRIQDDDLMIESLVMSSPEDSRHNRKFKSVVRPERVAFSDNPHYVHYRENFELVDENRNPVLSIDAVARPLRLRLNHYWTRDEEFFNEQKVPRTTMWGVSNDERSESLIELNESADYAILKFAPGLKAHYAGTC